MASSTQIIPPKGAWIQMSRTITVGNIATAIIWIVGGIWGLAAIQNQGNATAKEIGSLKEETKAISDIISVVQQNSATQTAMIESLRERLQRDEAELDGRRK